MGLHPHQQLQGADEEQGRKEEAGNRLWLGPGWRYQFILFNDVKKHGTRKGS